MTQINIVRARPGSEKQKAAGIFGTIDFTVSDDEGNDIVRMNGTMLRKKGDGSFFLAAPSYKATGVTKDDGSPQYFNHYQYFPFQKENEAINSKQRDRMNQLCNQAIEAIKREEGSNGQGTPQASPAPATTPSSSPW